MDLYTVQFVFYSLGIAFMLSLIVLVVVLIYVLYEIKKTVDSAVQTAKDTVDDVRNNIIGKVASAISDNRMKIVSTIGMGIVTFMMKRFGETFTKKKRSA